MIQHKVRKKKRPILMLMQEEKLDCPMYSKQTNLKGVYS